MHLLHGEGADQKVGPERDGDQEQPDIAPLLAAVSR